MAGMLERAQQLHAEMSRLRRDIHVQHPAELVSALNLEVSR